MVRADYQQHYLSEYEKILTKCLFKESTIFCLLFTCFPLNIIELGSSLRVAVLETKDFKFRHNAVGCSFVLLALLK